MAFGNTAELLGAKPSPISKSEYRNRQEKLYSQLTDESALIICSSSAKIRSNDVHHPYRTNSDLLYLTGWSEPDSVLLAIKKTANGTVIYFFNREIQNWRFGKEEDLVLKVL